VESGALCGLSQLSALQELRLGDVDGNNPDDVDTVCNMVTRLTSLHMVRQHVEAAAAAAAVAVARNAKVFGLFDVVGNNHDDVEALCNMVTGRTSLHMLRCTGSGA
jgi:hypothetical protein